MEILRYYLLIMVQIHSIYGLYYVYMVDIFGKKLLNREKFLHSRRCKVLKCSTFNISGFDRALLSAVLL